MELGLVDPRRNASLKSFLDGFVSSLSVKPSTITNYNHTARTLRACLGDDRAIGTVTTADAIAWRQSLISDGLASATVGRRITTAKTFFASAAKQKLIRENPFACLTGNCQINHARQFFVTREMTTRITDAAPDAQWRLLIALSRFGGLRTPSEPLLLRWADIAWDAARRRSTPPRPSTTPGKPHV